MEVFLYAVVINGRCTERVDISRWAHHAPRLAARAADECVCLFVGVEVGFGNFITIVYYNCLFI